MLHVWRGTAPVVLPTSRAQPQWQMCCTKEYTLPQLQLEQCGECFLCVQADRRALNITLNSIGTELTRDDRRKLYSNFGLLYPHGHHELASAEDFDQIRNAMEKCPPYQALFNKLGYGESQMLDKVGTSCHGSPCQYLHMSKEAEGHAGEHTGASACFLRLMGMRTLLNE